MIPTKVLIEAAKNYKITDEDIEKLKTLGFVTESFKHHYEYAIADTNIDLDKGWIN